MTTEGNFMNTTNTLRGWHGFDFMGFQVAGWIRERRPAQGPLLDFWTEGGELFVAFDRREWSITPPWWRSRN